MTSRERDYDLALLAVVILTIVVGVAVAAGVFGDGWNRP